MCQLIDKSAFFEGVQAYNTGEGGMSLRSPRDFALGYVYGSQMRSNFLHFTVEIAELVAQATGTPTALPYHIIELDFKTGIVQNVRPDLPQGQ